MGRKKSATIEPIQFDQPKKAKVVCLIVVAIIAMITFIAFLICQLFYHLDELKELENNTATEETIDGLTDSKIDLDQITTGGTETELEDFDIEDFKPLPDAINLQPVVDNWVNSTGGTKAVYIYDLDRNEVSAEYNKEKYFNTASLYKLFVVYEGYRRLENGTWNAEDRANYLGQTILDCLDLAIRESNSTCAEPLWSKIGHAELDSIIKSDFDIQNSNISGLSSNPVDIAKIMQIFYEHKEITNPDLVARIKDSFLNQPITNDYEWRQGLPSGFSDKTKVYNKVGWAYNASGRYWNIYHDAAIIETETGRHFIVVVMTNQVDFTIIRKLGTAIENEIYKNL